MTVKVKYEYNLRLRMTGRYERRLAVRACEARQMGTGLRMRRYASGLCMRAHVVRKMLGSSYSISSASDFTAGTSRCGVRG